MFRVSFHSHFEVGDAGAEAVVRFGLAQLDDVDPRRMPPSFAVELVLAPLDGAAAGSCQRRPPEPALQRLSSLAPLSREGYLWKRGEINVAFRKRWCCLRYAREGPGDKLGRGPSYSLCYVRRSSQPRAAAPPPHARARAHRARAHRARAHRAPRVRCRSSSPQTR